MKLEVGDLLIERPADLNGAYESGTLIRLVIKRYMDLYDNGHYSFLDFRSLKWFGTTEHWEKYSQITTSCQVGELYIKNDRWNIVLQKVKK